MSEVMLSLEGVSKTYNKGREAEVRVLSDVDLQVSKGEMVALVAPSGAGKSTLLHIAGLLDTPDAGSVEIGGTDYTGLSDRRRTVARRQEVGFVYQFHHLLPEFTALENIVLPQLANGVSRAEAEARAADLLAWGGARGTGPRRCRAANSSVSPFAARWPTRRACSWPMSRPAISIPPRRIRCSALWCSLSATRACRR